jgi:cytochrome c-type biogenesis protein CcmH
MKALFFLAVFSFLNGICCPAVAETSNVYSFENAEQQARFTYLTQQFRCLVCQNESLADSNAPLAQDLREQIAQHIQQGASNAAIKQYLLQRYGEFVLFQPLFNANTYILWFGPFVLLAIGMGALFIFIRRYKQQ